VPVKEKESTQGLYLSRGRHIAVYGEVRQKGIDLGLSHLARMLLPMKKNVPADPTDVGFRGAGAVMPRPPICLERLERLADGRLLYRFKRRWRDGTTHVVLEPLELLEKLSALVPAPRAHWVRYSGVLAPASKWRSSIVPGSSSSSSAAASSESLQVQKIVSVLENGLRMPDPVTVVDAFFNDGCLPPPADVPHGRNYSWAELMRRVWELDVLECPRCRGRMKIVAALHAPASITKILDSLGLPCRAPPVAPPCRDSQSSFDRF